MHANDRRGLHTCRAVHVIQMNQRHAAVRLAFAAGLDARLAADATRGIEKKFVVVGHFWKASFRFFACIRTRNPVGQFHVAYATRNWLGPFGGSWTRAGHPTQASFHPDS